jgi:hypothetical protein
MEEDALSMLTDFFGGGLERASQRFGYSFSPSRIRSTNVAARRKESACYTSFGIFSLG